MLSGLPIFTGAFASLPPHFPHTETSVIQALHVAFPQLNSNGHNAKMKKVCELCLASVIHHYEFLQNTLPERHILFENYLFRVPTLIETLQRLVVCGRAMPENDLRPTGLYLYLYCITANIFFTKGIPPHVLLLESMSSVRDEFKRSVNDIISKVEEKRDGLTRIAVRDVFKGK